MCELHIDRHPAAGAVTREPRPCEHRVAVDEDFERLYEEVRVGLDPALGELFDGVDALPSPVVGILAGVDVHGVVVVQLAGHPFLPVEPLVRGERYLFWLLRHTPPSMPLGPPAPKRPRVHAVRPLRPRRSRASSADYPLR